MRKLALVVAAAVAAGCADAEYGGNAKLAAEAGGDTLTSAQLARYLERVDSKLRTRALADFAVQAWVDYTLLARATASGTDLTADAIMGPALTSVRGSALTRQWHQILDARRPAATDAEIAAAYASDSVRVIEYLSWPLARGEQRPDVMRKKAQADSVHDRLVAGTSFDELLAALKRRGAVGDGGRLLTTKKGQLLEEFETPAWKLAPGEVTTPFLTRAGIQIARRPTALQARATLAPYARALKTIRADSLFVDSIGAASKLTVTDGAVPALRRSLVGLAADTPRVIAARWTGDSLTVAQLGPWLSALPPAAARALYRQSDENLAALVLRIARNVVLERAAAANGVVTPGDTIGRMVASYRADLAKARLLAGLEDPQVADTTASAAARQAIRRRKIDRYMDGIMRQSVRHTPLPAGLPALLRGQFGFRLHPAGIAASVTRAGAPPGAEGVADSAKKVPGIAPDS